MHHRDHRSDIAFTYVASDELSSLKSRAFLQPSLPTMSVGGGYVQGKAAMDWP